MFSRLFLRCVVFCAILYQAGNCRAAVITEGDAEFNGDIFVAHQEGDGSLTITAPTVLEGGGIYIANQLELTGTVTVDGGAYESFGGDFAIGTDGTGNFEILNGGRVSGENGGHLSVGSLFGSQGSVLVRGVGSRLDTPQGRAVVGAGGFGTFTLQEGARANHEIAGWGGVVLVKVMAWHMSRTADHAGTSVGNLSLATGQALQANYGSRTAVRYIPIEIIVPRPQSLVATGALEWSS